MSKKREVSQFCYADNQENYEVRTVERSDMLLLCNSETLIEVSFSFSLICGKLAVTMVTTLHVIN